MKPHELLRSRRLATRVALFVVAAALNAAGAQDPQVSLTPPRVISSGPHHRTWHYPVREPIAAHGSGPLDRGMTGWRTNVYVEVASGMHYLENGQWKASEDRIEVEGGRILARRGPLKVAFARNANTAGAVEARHEGGQLMRSHVLGVAYVDAVTGRSVLLGRVRDTQGELAPPNRWVYRDAFDGIHADIRYTYSKASMEQDVIVRAPLPWPGVFGLDPDSTRLEVITEFLDPPQPHKGRRLAKRLSRDNRTTALEGIEWVDERIEFDSLALGTGTAFMESDRPHEGEGLHQDAVPILKSWVQYEGRTFLLEAVDYRQGEDALNALPRRPGDAGEAPQGNLGTWLSRHDLALALARRVPKVETLERGPVRVAEWRGREPGWVMDYVLTLGTPDFTFESGTTYLIAGDVHLTGRVVIEGGAIIKYMRHPNPSRLLIQGDVDCRTSPWQPAIFTAMDDDTVGAVIPGSTGRPSGWYAMRALDVGWPGGTVQLSHLRVRHAMRGVVVEPGSRAELSHVQIGPGNDGIRIADGGEVMVRNGLMHDLVYGWTGGPGSVARGEHITMHQAKFFKPPGMAPPRLTNSLMIAAGRHIAFVGESNRVQMDASGVFQSAGLGRRYLAENSPFRGAGTLGGDPGLKRELDMRTTRPPVVLAGTLPDNLVLRPAGNPGNRSEPDLGYHYERVDYLCREAFLSGGRLTLARGVCVGMDRDMGGHGLKLGSRAVLVSAGMPERPNRVFPASAVQEAGRSTEGAPGLSGISGTPGSLLVLDNPGLNGDGAILDLRFTVIPMIGGGEFWAPGSEGSGPSVWRMKDCQIRGGRISVRGESSGFVLDWSNNYFDRTELHLAALGEGRITINHTMFRRGTLRLNAPLGVVTFENNLVDGAGIIQEASNGIEHGFNAYVAGGSRFAPPALTDVLLAGAPDFESGSLGDLYYAAGGEVRRLLVDGGSRPATAAGLWHHTTTLSDPVREGDSWGDVGFHYMAMNPVDGLPYDLDGDGIADYEEDANGDGIAGGDETDFRRADTDGDGVGDGEELFQGRDPVYSGMVEDRLGWIGLQLYTPLR